MKSLTILQYVVRPERIRPRATVDPLSVKSVEAGTIITGDIPVSGQISIQAVIMGSVQTPISIN